MTRILFAPLAIACLLMAACTTTGGDKKDTLPQAPTYPDSVALVGEVSSLLPADTRAVAVLDTKRLMNEHLRTAFGILEEDWNHKAMEDDIRKVMLARLKVDLTRLDWVVLATNKELVAAFLHGDIGKLPAEGTRTIAGLSVFHNTDEGFFLVKLDKPNLYALCLDEASIENLAALKKGDTKSLNGTDTLQTLQRLLKRIGDGDLAVAAISDEEDDEMLSEVPMGLGKEVGGFGFSFSDRFVIAIHGAPEALKENEAKITEALTKFHEKIAIDPNNLGDTETAEALGRVYLLHISGALRDQYSPSLEGDLLVYDTSMETLTHPITILTAVGGAVYFVFAAFFEGLGSMGGEAPHMQN